MKFIITPGSRDIAERATDEVLGVLIDKRGFIEEVSKYRRNQ